MIDLKKTYGDTYRITFDEAAPGETRADRLWLQQIPCKYGHIYIAGRKKRSAPTPPAASSRAGWPPSPASGSTRGVTEVTSSSRRRYSRPLPSSSRPGSDAVCPWNKRGPGPNGWPTTAAP